MPTITHNHTSNTRHNPLWRRGLHGATCIATVISTTFIPAAAADVTIQQIGQWGGPSYAIDICGTTAYVGVGHTLGIFDVSTPDAPYFVGRSAELLDLVRGVRVSGNYAYVANAWAGLQILDVSDPAAPMPLGLAGWLGYVWDVRLDGSYAYVAGGVDGLQIVDVSEVAAPFVVGHCDTPVDARGVAIAGGYAFVADGPGGLQIIDISDPAAPFVAGEYTALPDDANGVAVDGPYAYVAAGYSGGLQILSIADPANPVWVGACETWGIAETVSLSGNYAYVATLWEGLAIVDITDPAAPFRADGANTDGSANDVALAAGHAFVADGARGLQIFDISAPPAASWVAGTRQFMCGPVTDVAVDGNLVYISDGESGGGMQILDASEPAYSDWLGGVNTYEYGWGLTKTGNYAYLADGCAGLGVIDASDPVYPERIGHAPTGCAARDVVVAGDYAYVADDHQSLLVINISDPFAPQLVGQWQDPAAPGYALGIAVAGNCVYLANADPGLEIIDVADPQNPTRIAHYATGGPARDVAVVGDRAYLASEWAGLEILDVSDPNLPTLLGACANIGPAQSILVDGQLAYVTAADWGVWVVNVADPLSPYCVGNYNTGGFARRAALANGRLYVADGDNGLVILTVGELVWSNPYGGYFDDPQNWTPAGPPGPGQRAIFNLPESYTVTFSQDAAHGSTIVQDGNVALDLGGFTYTLSDEYSLKVGVLPYYGATLAVTNGVLNARYAGLGDPADAYGELQLSGVGTQLNLDPAFGYLDVGIYGAGLVGLADGATLNSSVTKLGEWADSQGEVTLETGATMSTWDLAVGISGIGALTIASDADVTNIHAFLAFGAGASGSATVTGAGSTWVSTDFLDMGREGTATLLVEEGGLVKTTNDLKLGELPGAYAELIVTGPDSRCETEAGIVIVGVSGDADLNVQAGGSIVTPGVLSATFGDSTGDIVVTGSTSSITATSRGVLIGREGIGTLLLDDGATLSSTSGWLYAAEQSGSEGWVTIQNGATASADGTGLGIWQTAQGHLVVTGDTASYTSTRQVQVGRYGTGELEVLAGADVRSFKSDSPTSSSALIGMYAEGVGVATVSGGGSRWDQDGVFTVGWFGDGTLHIDSGGQITNGLDGILGRMPGSNGIATVTGAASLWDVGGTLSLGGLPDSAGGSGTLNVNDEAVVWAHSRLLLWSAGTVSLNGGSVTVGTAAGGGTANTVELTTGGTLQGVGTITGNVRNTAGTVAPGIPTGRLHVAGDFVQQAAGTLRIELGGYDAATTHDQLQIDGTATLGGTLNVTLANDFVPVAGDSFVVLTGALAGTQFDVVNLPTGIPGVQFGVVYAPQSVTIVVSATTCPGDLNCDDQVNFVDINAFVLYLSNHPAWLTMYPACDPRNGDLDGNGVYPSFGDINPFVTLLTTNSLPIVCP
ncbi:MAG: hypothetical protein KA383_15540 [Phycisphaerae bacterium]|nr:hypothetical protein [Phycisphaerae bacterium]